MTNPGSDSFRNPTNYLGQGYRFTPTYLRSRDPISPTNASPDTKPKEQQGYYPVNSLWTNTSNGNVWVLAGIVNNLSKWILITGGSSGPALSFPVPLGTSPVVPSLTGSVSLTSNLGTVAITGGLNTINFDLTGGGTAIESVTVDNGTSPITPIAGNIIVGGASSVAGTTPVQTTGVLANRFNVYVQTSQAIAATDVTKIGLSVFNSAQFSVDASGFVSLVGGTAPAIQKVNVDAHTAPGTDPVVADGSGQINVTGGQVAAGVVGTNVIRTDSLVANTYTIEVQRSAAVAASDVAQNGVSHFDSNIFTVDANGFVSSTEFKQEGVANLGIAQTAGTTFTVTSANGTALSASNPGFVTLQNNATPGQLITYKITANQSFTQANISGNSFGIDGTVDWAFDMPFYLYAVSNAKNGENTIAFMVARIPHMHLSPVTANIGKQGSAVASTQGSMYCLPNVTVADYQASPALCIGSFLMTYAAAGTNWTITTLSNYDGIGQFNDSRNFGFPVGQNGNAAGKYFLNNGGTAPAFTSYGISYNVSKDGFCVYTFIGNNSTGVGAGAVTLLQSVPFAQSHVGVVGTGYYFASAGTTYTTVTALQDGAINLFFIKFIFVTNAATGLFQNASFNAVNIDLDICYTYFMGIV